jgi:hypothetical protein
MAYDRPTTNSTDAKLDEIIRLLAALDEIIRLLGAVVETLERIGTNYPTPLIYNEHGKHLGSIQSSRD